VKRTELKRKTPLRPKKAMSRGKPMARSRSPKSRPKRSPNEFPDETKFAVRVRSGGRCEANLKGCTGRLEHFHHRQSRRHKDQRPVNCLGVCAIDHAAIHANPTKAKLMGHIVSGWQDPAEVPIIRGDGGR
jgi:hypothetical protein